MIKTGDAKQKAPTHFEQVSLKVVEKVLSREAVRTNGGTKPLRETAARTIEPQSPSGSIARAAIKSKGPILPR
jgi:hypothetical protein